MINGVFECLFVYIFVYGVRSITDHFFFKKKKKKRVTKRVVSVNASEKDVTQQWRRMRQGLRVAKQAEQCSEYFRNVCTENTKARQSANFSGPPIKPKKAAVALWQARKRDPRLTAGAKGRPTNSPRIACKEWVWPSWPSWPGLALSPRKTLGCWDARANETVSLDHLFLCRVSVVLCSLYPLLLCPLCLPPEIAVRPRAKVTSAIVRSWTR